jgi:hypothetical protein
VNQRKALDEVAAKIGATRDFLEPWYQQNVVSISKLGFSYLVRNIYRGSVFKMLKAVYPEHEWLPWKFTRVPRTLSKDPETLRLVLDFLEKKYNLENFEDWSRLSKEQLKEVGLLHIIDLNGGLMMILRQFRPSVPQPPE